MAIAKLGVVVLDCPEPRQLSEFYAAVLGWEHDKESDADWVEITGPNDQRLAFQRSTGYQPPQWPGVEHGQQFHLDFDVSKDSIDEAERAVLELGAKVLEDDHGGKRNFRVYADPVGHPFCLCAH